MDAIFDTVCGISDVLADVGDIKGGNVLSSLLSGAGSAVCEIDKKIGSPALGRVCDVVDSAGGLSGNAFLDLLVQNDFVFRFVTAFQTAMWETQVAPCWTCLRR